MSGSGSGSKSCIQGTVVIGLSLLLVSAGAGRLVASHWQGLWYAPAVTCGFAWAIFVSILIERIMSRKLPDPTNLLCGFVGVVWILCVTMVMGPDFVDFNAAGAAVLVGFFPGILLYMARSHWLSRSN